MSVYTDNGYKNRTDYLRMLAEDYGLDYEMQVLPIAHVLGPNEDFDALVIACEDMQDDAN